MRSLGYVSQIGRHWTHGTFPNKPQRCFSTLVIQAKGVTRLWPEVRHHVGIDPTWCRPPAEFHSLTYDVGRVFVDESDSLPASHHHLRGGRLLQGTVEALATQPICSIRDVVDDRRRPLRPGDAHGSLDNHLRLARTGVSHLVYRRSLLGGAPLAQGTVYLLLSKRTADRLAVALITYIAIASTFVVTTPILVELAEPNRLSGEVMAWQWVRLFSPLVNLYAVVFLIGGAIWSAWRYRRLGDASSRVLGNALIAVGAILPGVGGGFARAGIVEVLYVTELIGLLLIWAGYRVIVGDRVISIHRTQRQIKAPSVTKTT